MQRDKIYGLNPVREMLRAGRPVQRILIADHRKADRDVQEIIKHARAHAIEVRFLGREAIDREAPKVLHQGVIAFAAARVYAALEDILDIPATKAQIPLFLILDGIEDPRNLGAILRTAEVAGVHGVVIPERRSVGLTDVVAKAAAGALEYIPVAKVANIVNTIEIMKRAGIWIAGAEADGEKIYWDADFTCPAAIVLGGEDKGVRRLVREHCDYLVSLPRTGVINSLNVSVAAGALLYEVMRQRRETVLSR